jgi:FMN phosphatase YigB (HAD superfamily)
MHSLRAIFFDVGDTLVFDDPPVEDRLWIALQGHGISFARENLLPALREAESVALGEYVQGRPPETPEVARAMLATLLHEADGISLTDRDLDALACAYGRIPFDRKAHPRAPDLLAELRDRGFTLGVISDWEADLGDVLTSLGIRPFLNAVAVSAIVGVTKPDPRLFRNALAQAGVSAEQSLHVGDFFELDVAGARSAGMNSLLFDHRRRMPSFPERVETFDRLCEVLLAMHQPQ